LGAALAMAKRPTRVEIMENCMLVGIAFGCFHLTDRCVVCRVIAL
jgi:hypothetical protein